MTARTLDTLPKTVKQHHIYRKSDFDFGEKLRSLAFQVRHRKTFSAAHYFFTPARLNALMIRTFIKNPSTIAIQTLATLREDLYSPEELKTMLFGDVFITYTNASRQKLESLGIQNVHTIPPGIPLETFSATPKDPETMRSLNLSENDFVVAYPGEYVRLGATDFLVEFIQKYFQTFPKSPLKFIFANRLKNQADRKKKEDVITTLRHLGILEKVRFSDTVHDVHKLYSVYDVAVFPVENLYGKFDVPLVIPETQACGKPVILSDLEQFREFTDEGNSVSVKRGDVGELIQAVELLRTHPEKRKTIAAAGKLHATQRFGIQNVARKYETLYDSLFQTHSPL